MRKQPQILLRLSTWAILDIHLMEHRSTDNQSILGSDSPLQQMLSALGEVERFQVKGLTTAISSD